MERSGIGRRWPFSNVIRQGGWRAANIVVGQQVLVNIAYFGVAKNLVMYLTTVMHQGVPKATKFVSNWSGTVFIAPLLGAFVADSCFGRYLTTVIFSFLFVVGTFLIALGTYIPSMYPPQCPRKDVRCESATNPQQMFLVTGLYITAISCGAFQPPVTALGADQFDEGDEIGRLQKSSYFNWFYQAIMFGAFVAALVIVTIQWRVSWGLGMTLSAGAAAAGLLVFLAGSKLYKPQPPQENAFARIAQVLVAAVRNSTGKIAFRNGVQLEDGNQSGSSKQGIFCRFLDNAAHRPLEPETSPDHNPWTLCSLKQVEEVKCLVRFIPIFLTGILYSTVYTQVCTLFVLQGGTLSTHLFAPASLSFIENLSVMVVVLAYDPLVVPLLRAYTGHPRGLSNLRRIGIGLGISVAAMVVAALVEMRRLSTASKLHLLDETNGRIPMSILWQVPQYFLVGASEVFTYIGLMEFFYDESPEVFRSVGQAVCLLTNGIGSYVNTGLVTIVNNITANGGQYSAWIGNNLNRSHVDRFYWLLAVLSFLNMLAFGVCAACYEETVQVPLTGRDPEMEVHVAEFEGGSGAARESGLVNREASGPELSI